MSRKTENGYYTVYTRQSKKVLEELENTGVYRVKEEYIRMKNDAISEYYLRLYRWFAERCRERIDVPQGCSFPIWLSMHDEYIPGGLSCRSPEEHRGYGVSHAQDTRGKGLCHF